VLPKLDRESTDDHRGLGRRLRERIDLKGGNSRAHRSVKMTPYRPFRVAKRSCNVDVSIAHRFRRCQNGIEVACQ
jgi:hypothetical protein